MPRNNQTSQDKLVLFFVRPSSATCRLDSDNSACDKTVFVYPHMQVSFNIQFPAFVSYLKLDIYIPPSNSYEILNRKENIL